MDIALILWLLQEVKDTGGSWQAFVIANMALLVGLAFWAGVQANKITNLIQRRKEDREYLDAELEKIDAGSQAVTVAKMSEKLDYVMDRIDIIQQDFEEFKRSVLIEALRLGKGGQPTS